MMTMFEILNRMYKLAVYDRNGRQYLPVRHPYKDSIAVYMRGAKAIEVEINRFVQEDRHALDHTM